MHGLGGNYAPANYSAHNSKLAERSALDQKTAVGLRFSVFSSVEIR
jgi:hypothetical protein